VNARSRAVIVVILLVGSACTITGSGKPVPEMTQELSAQLQARAFARACRDVICAGAPILAPDSTALAVSVDVLISRGQYDFVGRTYLFVWDGTQCLDTSPDTVDVTVTTSVS